MRKRITFSDGSYIEISGNVNLLALDSEQRSLIGEMLEAFEELGDVETLLPWEPSLFTLPSEPIPPDEPSPQVLVENPETGEQSLVSQEDDDGPF